jgi:hypothetical protein
MWLIKNRRRFRRLHLNRINKKKKPNAKRRPPNLVKLSLSKKFLYSHSDSSLDFPVYIPAVELPEFFFFLYFFPPPLFFSSYVIYYRGDLYLHVQILVPGPHLTLLLQCDWNAVIMSGPAKGACTSVFQWPARALVHALAMAKGREDQTNKQYLTSLGESYASGAGA